MEKDKRTLVTAVIPVYRTQQYLRRCVDSVLSQTHRNLQIILVDDGSPDGCPKICDAYAKRDERILVIHKRNGGVSSARNAALDVARIWWNSCSQRTGILEVVYLSVRLRENQRRSA